VHFDTGLLWVDVEDDFSRARRRHTAARVAGWLRRRPDATRILSFDEVVAVLGWRGERYLGLQTIRLDAVTGTVDSRRHFDLRFRPTSSRVRQRWERLDLAWRRGTAIPPIDVYLVGDLYFVKDGHHRVSVAAATRQKAIDAYVTEVRTRVPAAALADGDQRPPRRPAGRSDERWRSPAQVAAGQDGATGGGQRQASRGGA
jgi:hypothetical protein